MMRLVIGTLMLALLLPLPAVAAGSSLWEVGLRGGTDAAGVECSYKAGEIYLLRAFPWRVDLPGGMLSARLDLGAGYLEAVHDSGGWLACGADLVYSMADGLLELEAGFRPTWLIDQIYGNDDYGGDLQFTSHAGLAVHVDPVVISYRYLHISNASIYEENDGLNLHLFGVGVRF